MKSSTISAKPESVQRDWYIVDATDKTLGRLATELARRLRGKHKPVYTPHVDTGDYLVVVNAEKIAVTGKKMDDKIYHHVTGYIGNIKAIALKDLLVKHPERVIEIAVKGMLPKNPLAVQCTASSRSIKAPTIRISPSSRRRWKSLNRQESRWLSHRITTAPAVANPLPHACFCVRAMARSSSTACRWISFSVAKRHA